MSQLDVSSLVAGDEVGVSVAGHGWTSHYSLATVAKVLTHKVRLTDGREFNYDGWQRKQKYATARLVSVQFVKEQQAAKQLQNETNKSVDEIIKKLQNQKNGMGSYLISESTKAQLLKMVQDMPVNYEDSK